MNQWLVTILGWIAYSVVMCVLYIIGNIISEKITGTVSVKKVELNAFRQTLADRQQAHMETLKSFGHLHESHRVAMTTINMLREDKHLLQQLLARARAGESMGKSI